VLTIHSFLLVACELVGSVPPPPLCACIGMSWGDLYLDLWSWDSALSIVTTLTRWTIWGSNSGTEKKLFLL
jgi:hypothetical protein